MSYSIVVLEVHPRVRLSGIRLETITDSSLEVSLYRHRLTAAAVTAFLALSPAACLSQNAEPLQVGDAAPGFEITGANRGGILDAPLRLDDYRGKTVVLAFFYKVRTPG